MSAVRGLIRYVCPVDTPAPPPGRAHLFSAGIKPFRTITPAGEMQEIYLPFYTLYDERFDDDRAVNTTRGSANTDRLSETLFYNTQKLFVFRVEEIPEFYHIADLVDLKAVYEAMIQAAIEGVKLTFYPDINNKPTEVYTCDLTKRAKAKREGKQLKYTYDFDMAKVDGTPLPAVPVIAP